MYIGQSGRSVKERQSQLGVFLKNPEWMPFNDPHTAAPSLWAWRDATGWEFEVSGAPFDGGKREREGMEAYLLWQHRLERGESTLCNFGRFHEDYVKSSGRSKGFRGGRLPLGKKNPAAGPSHTPLKPHGTVIDADWMGLAWSEPVRLVSSDIRVFGSGPGVYRIMNSEYSDLLYIGQTKIARNRLASHASKDWGGEACVSTCLLNENVLPHQLKEIENDLIAAYFSERGRMPEYQIGG